LTAPRSEALARKVIERSVAAALKRKATIDHGIQTGIEWKPKRPKETSAYPSIRYVDVGTSVISLLTT